MTEDPHISHENPTVQCWIMQLVILTYTEDGTSYAVTPVAAYSITQYSKQES